MSVGFLAAAVLLSAAAGSAAAQQADPPPPTLSGELLTAGQSCLGVGGGLGTICVQPGPSEIELTSITCHPDGSGSVSFRASGPAVGPYPGTFTETGTFTFGEVDPLFASFGINRLVTSFSASFRIDSPVGTVEGRKFLDPVRRVELRRNARCTQTTLGDAQVLIQYIELILTDARYEAKITTAAGTFADRGQTLLRIDDFRTQSTDPRLAEDGTFVEGFVSDLLVPQLAATPGHVEGGGQVLRPAGGTEHVTFGFTARREAAGNDNARCLVVDKNTGTRIRCLTLETMVQTPTHATFSGQAEINGQITDYRIDVDDLDESGIGRDTFKIVAGGYTAGGVLTSGNIQIHPAT